ncbi:hypothetical protein TNCV_2022691 [Trichonephila clavipes]|nr:hypothetical protein TNCV_2022691 [Trichonephila clavipes]
MKSQNPAAHVKIQGCWSLFPHLGYPQTTQGGGEKMDRRKGGDGSTPEKTSYCIWRLSSWPVLVWKKAFLIIRELLLSDPLRAFTENGKLSLGSRYNLIFE